MEDFTGGYALRDGTVSTGRDLPYAQIPIEAIRQVGEEFAHADEWLDERGYRADVDANRRLRPGLLDLRAWLAATGAALITAFLSGGSAR